MYTPTLKQIDDLLTIRNLLENFSKDFKANLDKDNKIDVSLDKMLDLINEGYNSILSVMKTRL